MEYSYMRVAEADKYPAELKNTVFADTRGDPESPEFQRLLTVIQPNDSVHIPTLTDLGSSLAQVCEKWQQLLDLGVRIWLLDCPAAERIRRSSENCFSTSVIPRSGSKTRNTAQ